MLCYLAGVYEVLTESTVVFGGVLVHLRMIVQAGLAVESPAAELAPPPPRGTGGRRMVQSCSSVVIVSYQVSRFILRVTPRLQVVSEVSKVREQRLKVRELPVTDLEGGTVLCLGVPPDKFHEVGDVDHGGQLWVPLGHLSLLTSGKLLEGNQYTLQSFPLATQPPVNHYVLILLNTYIVAVGWGKYCCLESLYVNPMNKTYE